ncbi:alpha/beta hydrolase [bacterium]|nr:alpha/beta hydrolase [bacterium]
MLSSAILLGVVSLGGFNGIQMVLRRPGIDEPKPLASSRPNTIERPDGTKLHVEDFGPEHAPTIILVHGWGVDNHEWYYAKKGLSDRYRVVAWDLPGLGKSSRPPENNYDLARMADDLEAVVKWSKSNEVIIVGHSIGGMIAQVHAARYRVPSPVLGYGLIHTTYTNPVRTTRFAALYSAIEKPVLVPLLYLTIALSPLVWLMNILSYINGSAQRSTAKQCFSGQETRGQLKFAARYTIAFSPAVLARGMLAMLRYDATSSNPTVQQPALVIGAQNDPVLVVEASKIIADAIPRAKLHVQAKMRHQGHMESSADFIKKLDQFAHECLAKRPLLNTVKVS